MCNVQRIALVVLLVLMGCGEGVTAPTWEAMPAQKVLHIYRFQALSSGKMVESLAAYELKNTKDKCFVGWYVSRHPTGERDTLVRAWFVNPEGAKFYLSLLMEKGALSKHLIWNVAIAKKFGSRCGSYLRLLPNLEVARVLSQSASVTASE